MRGLRDLTQRAVVESHRSSPPLSPQPPHHLNLNTRDAHPSPPPSLGAGCGHLPPPKLPPVHVRVCEGSGGTLTIKISDQGGGIPPELADKVWSYGSTTIGRSSPPGGASTSSTATSSSSPHGPPDVVVEGLGSAGTRVPGAGGGGLQALMMPSRGPGGGGGGGGRYQMAGLGFGLPLSRLYARFFGGDLRLQSIPGYGVDAYLTLRRLEEHEWQWEEHVDAPSTLPLHMPY